ncbi:MAG: acyltransferase family protein, partial [Selenomonadaceae bacterium]|nr:acyltransferase family protein [Selenomonadaceae bacterium]
MKKNIAWIDTIRVLASFLVIYCHYLMCDGFSHEFRMDVRMYEVAVMCIALFFAISGYLIHPSVERMTSLKDYYKKKIIRLAVPFTVCYLVMSAAMSTLYLFDEQMTEKVPLFHALFGAKYFNVLLGMFPVDLNIIKFLGLDISWFTGEWFMGIILCMFLLSPFLDKCAVKAPILSLAASIALSFFVYNALDGWEEQDLIQTRWSMCLVRIPEFLFGIILFIYREKLLKIRGKLIVGIGVELGQPAYDPETAEKLLSVIDYDIVIGSVHNLRGMKDFCDLDYETEGADYEKLLDEYFDEEIALAKWNDFDTLGHLT